MNIYDIAKAAGVSIATVSRVVNGSPRVSEKTKEKVLSVIAESGYTPNVFARGLGLDSMYTIGILCPDISDAYMSMAVSCLETRLHSFGYNCILGCSGFQKEDKENYVKMLLSKRIDALIMVGSTYSGTGTKKEETDYIRLAAEQAPVFLVNGQVEGENIFCTVSGDRKAVYDAVSKLLQSGRKRILFLCDSHSYSANQKLLGYEQALTEYGMEIREALKCYTKNRIHLVRDMLLLKQDLSFDAVMATDDGLGVGVVKYAKVAEKKIPQDIAVVGYNNSALSVCSEPELTSVDNKTEQCCNDTVDRMLALLREGVQPRPSYEVPCLLKKRDTTDF